MLIDLSEMEQIENLALKIAEELEKEAHEIRKNVEISRTNRYTITKLREAQYN